MIETMTQILMVAAPIVFLIDFGGFVEKIKKWFFFKIYTKETPYEGYDIPPFDCSACLTVWVYWIVFGTLAIIEQQSAIEFIYIFTEGFIAGLTSILIRNKIILQ